MRASPPIKGNEMRTLLLMLLFVCGVSSAAPSGNNPSGNCNSNIQQINGTQNNPFFVQIKETDSDKTDSAEEVKPNTIVTIVGIALSSIIATIGLVLNARAIQRSNRIAASTKLAELSKLLSDELVVRVEMYGLLKSELREAEEYPDPEIANPKIEALKKSMEINLKRQSKLDEETKYLEEALHHLDKVDIGGIDAQIARSYRFHKIAESGLGQAKDAQ